MNKLSIIKIMSTLSVLLLIFAVGWYALSRMMQLSVSHGGDFQEKLFANIPRLNQTQVDTYLENVTSRKIYNLNSFPPEYSQSVDPFKASVVTDNSPLGN